MQENPASIFSEIENKIFNIRGMPVMLDSDLAVLYETDTRTLKQGVKRNIDKFPADFMFELNQNEIQNLVSQFVIPSKSYLGGAIPYAFTEQGVAMLSSIIKTEVAVTISIKIIRTFVAMRKSIVTFGSMSVRMENVENKLHQTDKNIEKIFSALERKETLPTQGILFNGQIFDAYKFVTDIIRKAGQSIILIDNYVDDNTLRLFAKRKTGIPVIVYTQKITQELKDDADKFNKQYGPLTIKLLKNNHDRFLIIDEKEMYHIGASLKDLGKKILHSPEWTMKQV